MERLTKRNSRGELLWPQNSNGKPCMIDEIHERLEAYEDTGLTPEDIEKLIKQKNQMISDMATMANALNEYVEAEEQGLLIKLPAPIGTEYTGICRQQVPARTGWKTKSWIDGGKVVGYTVIAELTADKAGYNHQRDIAEIGEVWFVGENQKEAAEEALKGDSL